MKPARPGFGAREPPFEACGREPANREAVMLYFVFSMTSSLHGCVVEAVPPRRQPLPAGQTAHRCVFPGSDPGIENHGFALMDPPAAGSS